MWLTNVALGFGPSGIMTPRRLSWPCHTLPDSWDAKPSTCSNISVATLAATVRQSQDMIGRLLSAGVDPFQLNFGHAAQTDHAMVAQYIRRQRAFAGKPDRELGRLIFVIYIMVLFA